MGSQGCEVGVDGGGVCGFGGVCGVSVGGAVVVVVDGREDPAMGDHVLSESSVGEEDGEKAPSSLPFCNNCYPVAGPAGSSVCFGSLARLVVWQ
jgi:hypothetical protein